MLTLALMNLNNPMLWAILIGWILSVTIHEFSHGLAAHLGGDYTIAERGGLTLNPLQYIDPLGSLVFPAIIFLIGGIPLPGGATYVRDDLLRGRGWRVAMSAAGPFSNFIMYLILCLLLSPGVGWVQEGLPVQQWTQAQLWVGALAVLQILSVVLNLLPIPPLDGFHMISPFLPEHVQEKLNSPGIRSLCYFGYFMLLTGAPLFWYFIYHTVFQIHGGLGFNPDVFQAWNRAMYD
ncbi:MAG: site-2 protease family protein [Tepidisphaeraceae bacterium]|jgi:Zn-dependent protease